jgi:sigma-B regulation protein RsbU (phosphoserine phosphatase)
VANGTGIGTLAGKGKPPTAYEIHVREALSKKWQAYFAPFVLTNGADETILIGVVRDQAELFGALLKIRNLGLSLVSLAPGVVPRQKKTALPLSSKAKLTNETKYRLLLQISHKVRNTLDLDEILNLLLDSLQSVLSYDAAGIFVLNQDGIYQPRPRTPAVIAGIARCGFDLCSDNNDRMLMRGEGITGYVIRTGSAVIVPDVSLDPRYIVGRIATCSEIAVPIIQDEKIIGALNVESDRLAAFNTDDLDILRFFADAAAISIEKATLHQSLLEKQSLDQQIKTASAVQSRLIPKAAPQIPGYDIHGVCLPVFAIGGDYFDYIPCLDGRLGISLADISGDGVPAALVMSAFRALLRSQAHDQTDPALTCARLNALLPDFTGAADFVTAIYGLLDWRKNTFTYTNCGHPPIFCCRASGEIEQHKSGGPALSVFNAPTFESGCIALGRGDMLVFYTDGVFEASDRDGNMFGFERLIENLSRQTENSAQETLAEIIRAMQTFCKTDTFSDDVTLLILKRTA